jgi:competence protein ComEC
MHLLPVLTTAALGAGIVLALAFELQTPIWPLGTAAGLTASALAAWVQAARVTFVVSAGLGIAALGASLGAHADARARSPALSSVMEAAAGAVVALRGVLTEDANVGPNGVRLRLSVRAVNDARQGGGETAALTVAGVLAPAHLSQWTAGRTVDLSATLRRPAHYLNPGVPDDRLALARRGLVAVGTVKSAALVRVVSPGTIIEELAARIRGRVRRAMAAHVAPHDETSAAISTAILIGDRAGLDPALESRLQAAGTYHVIAISGGNIAVLAAVLLGIVRIAGLHWRLGYILVALLLVAHADLVGAGPSVARATTMAVVFLGLRCLDQSAWSLNALAVAAGGLLLVRPLAIIEPGFVLSVGATAAIIVLTGRLMSLIDMGVAARLALGVLGASLATEIVLLPISATLFNRVTAAGLVLNLGAVPLMAVVQIAASVVALTDGLLPALARPAGLVASLAAQGLVGSSALVEWWPWLAFRTPAPHPVVAGLYLFAVVAGVAARSFATGAALRRVTRTTAAIAVVTGCTILTAPQTWRWPWRADGLLRIVALDVGQGDATLVEFPDGSRWLVDAGGLAGSVSFDIGARVIAPALWTRGVGRLDRLVLTHGDPDHIGGARAVVDDFSPAVSEGVVVPSHAPMTTIREYAGTRGHTWSAVTSGTTWAMGEVAVRVWHPDPPDWERQRVRNDDSVVLELRYRDVSVVLPGDISAEVERTLAERIPPARVRVLKLAHHGSATSTSAEWLDALRPHIAIVSCGRDNRYGHPAGSVMARLGERGIAVRRTDVEGMVVVATDGRSLAASGYLTDATVTKDYTKVTTP